MTEQLPAGTPTGTPAADAKSGAPDPKAATQPAGEAKPATDAKPTATVVTSTDQVAGDSAKPDGDAGAKPKEGEAGAGDEPKAPEVPEKYDLKAPEGFNLEPETTAQFETVARELKLSNDQANQLVPLGAKLVQKAFDAQQAAHAAQVETWLGESKADKEYGGEKFDASIKTVRSAVAKFTTPEFKQLMDQTGIGNHPEVIRLFYRIGNAIADDKFIGGTGGDAGKPSLAARLYPKT